MEPTNIFDPNYFHKVVDCQYACPAHTPVPEYIRLIAQEKYTETYMLNWDSNVFPGFLGEPVTALVSLPADVCGRKRPRWPFAWLKRAAADNKGDVSAYLPSCPRTEER